MVASSALTGSVLRGPVSRPTRIVQCSPSRYQVSESHYIDYKNASAETKSSPVLLCSFFNGHACLQQTESTRVESEPAAFECAGAVWEGIALALAIKPQTLF